MTVCHVVPPSVVVVSCFLILSRKPTGTALGSSCLKSGTDKTGFVVILMMSDQVHIYLITLKTQIYAFKSHILIFIIFHDFS